MNLELDIESLGGMCPVQAEGRINDKQFYFRARHDAWSLRIAATVDDAIGTPEVAYAGAYGEVGGYDAGYMPEDEARAIIRCCAQQYIAERFAIDRRIAQWRALQHRITTDAGDSAPDLTARIEDEIAQLEAKRGTA